MNEFLKLVGMCGLVLSVVTIFIVLCEVAIDYSFVIVGRLYDWIVKRMVK